MEYQPIIKAEQLNSLNEVEVIELNTEGVDLLVFTVQFFVLAFNLFLFFSHILFEVSVSLSQVLVFSVKLCQYKHFL